MSQKYRLILGLTKILQSRYYRVVPGPLTPTDSQEPQTDMRTYFYLYYKCRFKNFFQQMLNRSALSGEWDIWTRRMQVQVFSVRHIGAFA